MVGQILYAICDSVILSTRSIAIVISIVMSVLISIPEHSLLQVCLNRDVVIAKIDEKLVKRKLQINCAFTRFGLVGPCLGGRSLALTLKGHLCDSPVYGLGIRLQKHWVPATLS